MISAIPINDAVSFGVELPLSENLISKHIGLLAPCLNKAVNGRQQEFIAGRACAEIAMKSLGVSGVVGFGDDRRPVWPNTIVGSITHSKKLAIASVALADEFLSIGIDCETLMTKDKFDSLSKHLATKEDLKLFGQKRDDLVATIIFSAKESLFKLINPLCDTFFGFEHASVKAINQKSFQIELHSKIPEIRKYNNIYEGTFRLIKNQVVTSIMLTK